MEEDKQEQQTEPIEEHKEIFEDFDPELFTKPPTPEGVKKFLEKKPYNEDTNGLWESNELCPYYPKACGFVGTSRCNKDCEHHPENYMDLEVKKIFDIEPWSNYCFNCGEFIPSRRHEDALEPPELIYSHIVATGYAEYRIKLPQWVMKRITGKEGG